MPGLDEARLIIRFLPCSEQSVDAVARVAEDLLDAPLAEPLQDVVGNCRCHR
jgi:hypothetical protein